MAINMDEPDSQFMNYVVRMVIPMKREFGRSLDVSQFLHDRPYATEVIQQALQSKDDRLREYAAYLDGKMFGPRNSSVQKVSAETAAPGVPPAAPPAEAGAPAAVKAATVPTQAGEPTHAELRARMLAKYKSGLR